MKNRKSGISIHRNGNGSSDSEPRRALEFLYHFPGLIEAIATTPPNSTPRKARTTGYAGSGVWDLEVDRDLKTQRPYAWQSINFDTTYPLVIWGLRYSRMNDELFDVPQAHLHGVPLHVAFSWAYYHFILEDGKRLPKKLAASAKRAPRNLPRTVLTYSLNNL